MSRRCNQCEALVINGLFCHEHGCPNERKEFVDGEWVEPEPEEEEYFDDEPDYDAPSNYERQEQQHWIQHNLK